jgi:predicted metal-dependent enzyme (double-stranded beta helix superfamily)
MLRFDPVRRWWARLALTEGVELWLLSWDRGQSTEPHDHGGAAGSFSVLLGRLDEHYRYPGGPIRHKRHQVGGSIAFGPTRTHQMRNTGTRKAASVHAYSPPLLPVREYPDLLNPGVPQPRVSR